MENFEQFDFDRQIIGKGKEADWSAIEIGIAEMREKGKEHIEGELEKTPEQLAAIGLINDYLKEEFADLDIGEAPEIDPERFHLLPEEKMRDLEIERDVSGEFSPLRLRIIASTEEGRVKLYHTMMHESIHAASMLKYFADTDQKKISDYRTGYGVAHPSDHHEHFRGFNEIVTEKIAVETIIKHSKELKDKFQFSDEEVELFGPTYQEYQPVLATIIAKVAEKKGESWDDVWKRIKKGIFTGEMMHLRDIEDVFGKGALRVVAALNPNNKEKSPEEESDLVMQYFNTEDKAEREHIAHTLLDERELGHYNKRRA